MDCQKNNANTFESCFKTGNVRIKIAPIIIFEVMHNGCVKTARNLPCRDAGISDFNQDGEEEITDYNGLAPDMGAIEFRLAAPSGLQVFPQNTSVVLLWNDVGIDDLQYYLLERSTSEEFDEDVSINMD